MSSSLTQIEPTISATVEIETSDIMDARVRQLGEALAEARLLFRRGALIVQPPHHDGTTLRIVPHCDVSVERYASVACSYWKRKLGKDGSWTRHEAAFPVRDGRALLASAEYPASALEIRHVLEAPAMLPSGRILTRRGYDEESGAYLAGELGVRVPTVDVEGAEDAARAAVDTIWSLVDEVPFDGGREGSSFGAWLAALLVPFARLLYSGPTPGLFVDSSTQGSGKTRLCKLIGAIGYDRLPGPTVLPANDDASKILFALALEGRPLVFVDNVRAKLTGSALEGALTADSMTGRVLGASRIETVPWAPQWLFSGNNATVSRDMSERLMHCRLSPEASGTLRHAQTRFRIADVWAHLDRHRERYVVACLTLLRAAHVLGWPASEYGSWGSYEGWSRIIPSALHVAGVTDPRAGLEAWADAADEETSSLRSVLLSWPPGREYRASEIAAIIDDRADSSGFAESLREWISTPRPTAKSVGAWLGNVIDRDVTVGRLRRRKHRLNHWEYYSDLAADAPFDDDEIP